MGRSRGVEHRQNRLLAGLPARDAEWLIDQMSLIEMPLGQVFYEAHGPIEQAWFPVSGVVSALIVTEGGDSVDAGTIGNEGMVGLPLAVGARTSLYRTLQQVAGAGWRIDAGAMEEAIRDRPSIADAVHCYTMAMLQQTAQNTACNLLHSVEERMCRWLLATRDRLASDQFHITQEFLGEMLGASRQHVSLTAGALQRAGLISYRRGNMDLRDTDELERLSCECYRVTRSIYDGLLPPAKRR